MNGVNITKHTEELRLSIQNLDELIKQNSYFEISKVYDIGL